MEQKRIWRTHRVDPERPQENYWCNHHRKQIPIINMVKGKTIVRRCPLCYHRGGRKNPAHLKMRLEAIVEYGGHCVCCGESEIEFMTFDHIDGKGAEHRKADPKANHIVRWLKAHDWPKDNFQLLCMNCNWAKRWDGTCPHTRPEMG